MAMGEGTDGDQVSIPSVMLSQEDCAILRVAFPFVAELTTENIDGEQPRDGSLDNGVIAHEYGHGISNRLAGGPSASTCLFNDEQGGEGWSDFFSLIMTHEMADDRNTARGIGTYASDQPLDGNGIRTYPYSADMNVNPHTYANIADYAPTNPQDDVSVHGVGSVLCVMLWDLHWDLVDTYGYDPDLYHGAGGNNICMQLVMDGLKLMPCSPGFVDVRDAIILADQNNNDGANYCLIWNTFARRGLGYSASQGTSFSVTDGNEAFDLPPDIPSNTEGLSIVKSSNTTQAELGDIITYTLTFGNNCNNLENIDVTDILPSDMTYVEGSASNGGVHDNGTITWPTIGIFNRGEELTYTYQAEINNNTVIDTVETFNDDIENGADNWTISNTTSLSNWQIVELSNNLRWFAEELEADPEPSENQYLMMGPVFLDGNAELSFSHKYDTEANWDGGRVEISIDNQFSWIDLGEYFTENGYNDYIQDNPNEEAFAGNSVNFITSIANLRAFCGETVYIRFNFYYDQLQDGRGWYVDDVILNTSKSMVNVAQTETNNVVITDGHCVHIDEDSTIPTQELNQNASASIYPNPNNGNGIFLDIKSDAVIGNLDIEIYNSSGQLIHREERNVLNNESTFSINNSKLSSGHYHVKLTGDEFSISRKFVVLN